MTPSPADTSTESMRGASRRSRADIQAGGAVVTRKGKQVLLVHRPTYDDWSFPKGKLDKGEHVTAAAIREVAEETGLDIRLGPPLQPQRYPVGKRWKLVHYWVARVVGDDDVSKYRPNHEIDDVEWVPLDKAMDRLTYRRDRETLQESLRVRKKTRAIVVLRHARARSRSSWRRDDAARPLLNGGRLQAERLVPLLAAYDVTRLISSPARRCLDTVGPYAGVTGEDVEEYACLSEDDADLDGIMDLADALWEVKQGVLICTHRPVLPDVCRALGVPETTLEPGGMLVVHHRKGTMVATERHEIG